jgi:hypothetical protein
MLNILESLRILYCLGFSQYNRYIVSRCLSDIGGGGLNDGFMGKGYSRYMVNTSVIYMEARRRTQLLCYLSIVEVQQTCTWVLSLQEIVYKMQGQYRLPVVERAILQIPRSRPQLLLQHPKLWVVVVVVLAVLAVLVV